MTCKIACMPGIQYNDEQQFRLQFLLDDGVEGNLTNFSARYKKNLYELSLPTSSKIL